MVSITPRPEGGRRSVRVLKNGLRGGEVLGEVRLVRF
jgi:hypothetical protein